MMWSKKFLKTGRQYLRTNMDKDKVIGTVFEVHRNGRCEVKLIDGSMVHAYIAGKLRYRKIKIIIGDRVEVKMVPKSDIHRIVYRHK